MSSESKTRQIPVRVSEQIDQRIKALAGLAESSEGLIVRAALRIGLSHLEGAQKDTGDTGEVMRQWLLLTEAGIHETAVAQRIMNTLYPQKNRQGDDAPTSATSEEVPRDAKSEWGEVKQMFQKAEVDANKPGVAATVTDQAAEKPSAKAKRAKGKK
jgi:hypothetical protein